jgi:hypothetical protein
MPGAARPGTDRKATPDTVSYFLGIFSQICDIFLFVAVITHPENSPAAAGSGSTSQPAAIQRWGYTRIEARGEESLAADPDAPSPDASK